MGGWGDGGLWWLEGRICGGLGWFLSWVGREIGDEGVSVVVGWASGGVGDGG